MEYTIGAKVFRDWEIIAEIGEGSYGKVYQLRKESFGIVANGALKVIRIPRSASDVKDALSQGMDEQSVTSYFKGVVDEFMREVAVMSDMKSHPNVVGCQDYDIISHAGGMGWDILIRMDLLTPLQEYQTKHTMDETQVRRLGVDLCVALVYCQKRGLIHRDIKPGNIFVDELGRFRLGDFGVARTADRTMGGMSKQGTENYMAPEVYLGKEYGPTVDIYSLGMVLYQLMNANRLPFYPLPPAPIEFSHRFEVLKKRMGGVQMPPPCSASEDFAAIILKACSFESKDRYRTASDLLDALKGSAAAQNAGYSAPFAPEQMTDTIPASAPVFPSGDPVPPPMDAFPLNTPTGDETIGPAFATRAPQAEPQPAAAPLSAFSAPPKAPQEPVQQNDAPFQMILEDAFNIPGRGVVVTGYVCFAAIHTGDPITILRKNGTQRAVTVAGIEHNQQIIPSAQPGTAVGILLSGLSVQDVSAGDKLVGKASAAAFGTPSAPTAGTSGVLGMAIDNNEITRISCMDANGSIRTMEIPALLGKTNGRWCVGEEARRCANAIQVFCEPDDKQVKALDPSFIDDYTNCISVYLKQAVALARRNGMEGALRIIADSAFSGQERRKTLTDACNKAGLGTVRIYTNGEMSAVRFCTSVHPEEGAILVCHADVEYFTMSLLQYGDDVLEAVAFRVHGAFSKSKLDNLQASSGCSRDQAANQLFDRLTEGIQEILTNTSPDMPLRNVVLCGDLADIPALRWRLAALLGMEPVVMEHPAFTSAEGAAVMTNSILPHSGGSQIMLLSMTEYHYGIVDQEGDTLLLLERCTTIPVRKSCQRNVTKGEVFFLFEADSNPDPDDPPIEQYTAAFTGKAKLTLWVETDGVVRFSIEPTQGTPPRKSAQPKSNQAPPKSAPKVKADTDGYQQPAPSANTDYYNHHLEKFGVNIVYPGGRLNEIGDLYLTATEMIFVKKSKGARLVFGFVGTALEKGEEKLRFNLADIISGGRTKIGLNSNVYQITLRNGEVYKICVNNPAKIACLEQRFGR